METLSFNLSPWFSHKILGFLVHFLASGLCCPPWSQDRDSSHSHATRSRHVTICVFSNFESPSYFFIKLLNSFQVATQSGNNQAIFAIAQNHFVFQIASGFCLRMKCVFHTSMFACSCVDSVWCLDHGGCWFEKQNSVHWILSATFNTISLMPKGTVFCRVSLLLMGRWVLWSLLLSSALWTRSFSVPGWTILRTRRLALAQQSQWRL